MDRRRGTQLTEEDMCNLAAAACWGVHVEQRAGAGWRKGKVRGKTPAAPPEHAAVAALEQVGHLQGGRPRQCEASHLAGAWDQGRGNDRGERPTGNTQLLRNLRQLQDDHTWLLFYMKFFIAITLHGNAY